MILPQKILAAPVLIVAETGLLAGEVIWEVFLLVDFSLTRNWKFHCMPLLFARLLVLVICRNPCQRLERCSCSKCR